MKDYRKSLFAIAFLFCAVSSGIVVYGMFQVASNVVYVNIQYVVDLTISMSRNRATLTATVTNNGNPAGAGVNVKFCYSLNGGSWVQFATQPTNHRGIARTSFRLTVDGVYEFNATTSFQ